MYCFPLRPYGYSLDESPAVSQFVLSIMRLRELRREDPCLAHCGILTNTDNVVSGAEWAASACRGSTGLPRVVDGSHAISLMHHAANHDPQSRPTVLRLE